MSPAAGGHRGRSTRTPWRRRRSGTPRRCRCTPRSRPAPPPTRAETRASRTPRSLPPISAPTMAARAPPTVRGEEELRVGAADGEQRELARGCWTC
ncbi:hypothetical protein EE612_000163 [Oryza sativa]|nr:hypothetical protein EE612_000163 [Oryza sativa]